MYWIVVPRKCVETLSYDRIGAWHTKNEGRGGNMFPNALVLPAGKLRANVV